MKYHTLFFSKIRNDIAKFVVCCSRDGLIKRFVTKYRYHMPCGKYLRGPPHKENKKFTSFHFYFFVAFPWVETSTRPGGFMICEFII